jgi:hypothetical protein
MHLPLVFFGLIDVLYLLARKGDVIDWDLVSSWLTQRDAGTPIWLLLGFLEGEGLIDLGPEVVARIGRGPKSVGRPGRRVLFRIVERCLAGSFPGGIASKEVSEIVWQTLLFPKAALTNLYAVPCSVAFPPRHEQRFSLRFQLHRMKSLVGLHRES